MEDILTKYDNDPNYTVVSYLQVESRLPMLYVMCGLQCSGKSTKAKELKEMLDIYSEPDYKTVILSSDEIRKEHPEIANDNNKVFSKLYADMNYFLRLGDNVIIDATNITNKARRQIFNNLHEDCGKCCWIMNTNYNTCLERLRERNKQEDSHKVPEEVLKRYFESFEIPFYEEGWDNISIEHIIPFEQSDENITRYLNACEGFNQKNKHHTQDLGLHMRTVTQKLNELTGKTLLIEAGSFHDVGKLFTQTVGEDGNCHYYNHDSVGAYNLMCDTGIYTYHDGWVYDTKSTLKWLFYINYHMKLHNVTTEKSIRKWKNILGEENYNDLRVFEQADKWRGE